MIDVVKMVFNSLKSENLPIYGVKSSGLQEFTTSQKDMKKGISRIPLEMARLKEEDIYSSNSGSTSSSLGISDSDFENFNQYMNERAGAYAQNCIPTLEMEKECR